MAGSTAEKSLRKAKLSQQHFKADEPGERTPAIQLSHVSVRLAGRTVLRDLSFSIRPGEFAGCIGPNGAGKSTLLRTLLGLIPIQAGQASVFGQTPRRGDRRIGYVPQHQTLAGVATLRARDVVGLGIDGARLGMPLPSRERSQMIEAALHEVRATEYGDAPVAHLSGGEQQRLMLAQALIGRPDLLLLDEPLANLDLRSRAEVVELVSRLCKERGTAVMFVAHDVNPLLPVMDRVLYLAEGRGVVGAPDQVIDGDVLTSLFGFPVQVIRAQGYVLVTGMDQGEHCHA